MSELYQFVKKQTSKLSNISCRKVYGLEAFYLRDKPYIVISSDDKVVIKIDDFEVKKIFLEKYQISTWQLNGKAMENWYVLPTTFNKKKSKLAPIIEMSSKALLNPRKEKKTRTKKSKVQKKNTNIEKAVEIKKSPSIFKKLFKFLN